MSMTQAQALSEARRLQTIMRSKGVECAIDLKKDSGGRWGEPMANRVGHMAHHVWSSRAHGATRFYQMVRNGDPSRNLPGPLANGYMGWDGVYRIITLGRANHPGAGGPLTLAGRTIPKNNARPYLWGTEFEGGMNAAEWTPEFREKMALACASILEWEGRPVEANCEHSTWAPRRKNDRLGYDANRGRQEIRAALGKTGSGSTPVTLTPAPSTPSNPYKRDTAEIQRRLASMGLYKGRIDNDYGSMTKLSVTTFQQRANRNGNAGLVVDGDWGARTEAWYQWVVQAQKALNNYRAVKGLVLSDGDYGPTFGNQVRAVQRTNGLVVDGILGPIMIAWMKRQGSAINSRP